MRQGLCTEFWKGKLFEDGGGIHGKSTMMGGGWT